MFQIGDMVQYRSKVDSNNPNEGLIGIVVEIEEIENSNEELYSVMWFDYDFTTPLGGYTTNELIKVNK